MTDHAARHVERQVIPFDAFNLLCRNGRVDEIRLRLMAEATI